MTNAWRRFRAFPLVAQISIWVVLFFVVVGGIGAAAGSGKTSKKNAASSSTVPTTTSTTTTATTYAPTTTPPTTPPTTVTPTTSPPTTAPPTTIPARHIAGKAVILGAGTFSGGTNVVPGLYNVTPGAGQSGNFVVTGNDEYDEILGGGTAAGGVPEVRAQISAGDSIMISGLSQVRFTPVTTPLVTTHARIALYTGTWTVGQDLGAGGYVATPGAGESGNFIIENEDIDEILGGGTAAGGVPNVTVNVQTGDVIEISGLASVTMTPN